MGVLGLYRMFAEFFGFSGTLGLLTAEVVELTLFTPPWKYLHVSVCSRPISAFAQLLEFVKGWLETSLWWSLTRRLCRLWPPRPKIEDNYANLTLSLARYDATRNMECLGRGEWCPQAYWPSSLGKLKSVSVRRSLVMTRAYLCCT